MTDEKTKTRVAKPETQPQTQSTKPKPRPTTPQLYNRGKKPKVEAQKATIETRAAKPKSANAIARDKNNAKKGQRNQNRPKPENSKARARANVPQERYFFGVFIPKELHVTLETMQKKLVGKWWKATPSDQFHITLLYLGGASKKNLEQASIHALEISKTTKAFTAKLRGTGFFPNEGGPRVWFVKAESEIFTALHEALRDKLEIVPEEKFKPHVTLARKKGASPRPAPIVLDLEWQISEFVLVKSTLAKEGPTYSILERFILGDTT
jgi:RNA 2',3'-cyclic 3'-phosphodiesterase